MKIKFVYFIYIFEFLYSPIRNLCNVNYNIRSKHNHSCDVTNTNTLTKL